MTTPVYRTTQGPTTAEDPNRLVWYSPVCGYWTDDYSELGQVMEGSYCCPTCGMSGYTCTVEKWNQAAAWRQQSNNPRYVHPRYIEFLNSIKSLCNKDAPGLMDQYREWIKKQPIETVAIPPKIAPDTKFALQDDGSLLLCPEAVGALYRLLKWSNPGTRHGIKLGGSEEDLDKFAAILSDKQGLSFEVYT